MISRRNFGDDSLPWEHEAYHVAARYREVTPLLSAGVRLLFVEVLVGGRLLPHARREEVWWVCLEGEGLLVLGEEEEVVRPGDVVHVRPGQVQGMVNGGVVSLRLLQVCSVLGLGGIVRRVWRGLGSVWR